MSDATTPHERLVWAVSVVSRFGGPASQAAGEPVFAHLPELTEALTWACAHGSPEEVALALPLADVLGAAWDRQGEPDLGRERLDAMLAAAARAGLPEELPIARVLRRRARLALQTCDGSEAYEDLDRAYRIASARDPRLTVSIVLDRADLALHRGDWECAAGITPELLERTEATGDPLLQAMGLNRAGWAAFCHDDLPVARERYERSWALAELHEDPVVEARSAAGLGLLAMLDGQPGAHAFWQQALQRAEQLHDRSFTLFCLDGIAAMLVLQARVRDGGRLSASVSAARQVLRHPREAGMAGLHTLVVRRSGEAGAPWSYAEAVAFARVAVASATQL